MWLVELGLEGGRAAAEAEVLVPWLGTTEFKAQWLISEVQRTKDPVSVLFPL